MILITADNLFKQNNYSKYYFYYCELRLKPVEKCDFIVVFAQKHPAVATYLVEISQNVIQPRVGRKKVDNSRSRAGCRQFFVFYQ